MFRIHCVLGAGRQTSPCLCFNRTVRQRFPEYNRQYTGYPLWINIWYFCFSLDPGFASWKDFSNFYPMSTVFAPFISHAQFQRPAMQSHCWRDAVQFQRARNKGGAMLTVSRQFILFYNFLKAVKLADMIQQDKQSFRQRCLKAPVYWWACSSQQTCDPWQSWHNKTHS